MTHMRAAFLIATLTPALVCAAPVRVPLQNPGFETGALDGWDRAVPEELFSVSDTDAHSGGFCLRAHGDPEHQYNGFVHLVQVVDLTPIPGASYEIAAWARVEADLSGGKSARLAVRQVNVEDTTIEYADAYLPSGEAQAPAPQNAAEWEAIGKRFRAAAGTVRFEVYVILQNLERDDVIFVDDIELLALDATGDPVTATPPAFSGGGESPERLRRIECRGLVGQLDEFTGLLSSLWLYEPTPRTCLQPPAPDATIVFAQVGDREIRFDRVLERRGDVVVLGSEDDALPLRARVEYTTDARGLTENVTFEATGDLDEVARLGVRHGFVPDAWERIICAMRPIRAIEAGESTVFSYGERADDLAPTQLDTWQSVTFPMTVLEGDDRFVCVGSTDLDDFVTVTPNQPSGYFPSVQMNPTRIREGDVFPFTLRWQVFPKSEALLRDVWRWYGAHLTSANPLLEGLVPIAPHDPPRTLPPGLEVSAGGFWAREGARIDVEKAPRPANVWYFGWHDWLNERYPTEGDWWCRAGGWGKENAEGFREAIASYQAAGRHCYLYFRDIANLTLRGNPLPEDWFLSSPGGALDMYGGGYAIELPPEIAAEAGYDRIEWGTWDFSNNELRADYVQQVKDCMDFYRPAGIAWDMGWRPNNPGILAVQAASYRWLQENHPEMRVISNEASGTPSQRFADCILIENGILYGKSVLDYEVAKAFGTQIASIERGHQYIRAAERILSNESNWPFAESFADARRFAEWSMNESPLPDNAGAAKNELAFRMNVRGGLRCLGLGAQWAYVPDALYGPRPVPPELLALMSDLMAMPPLHESFAVRIDGGSDAEDGVYAAAWADAEDLVLAVFNDSVQTRSVEVRMDVKALVERGFDAAHARWSGMSVDSFAQLSKVPPGVAAKADAIAATVSLQPFTLEILRARQGHGADQEEQG